MNAADDSDSIWIESTRGPDHEPVCLVTFGPLQYYAPVADVRQTAIDLVTCAAYAEMMMTLVVRVNLGADVVSRFAADLLSGAGRRYFGAKTTVTMLPAGSTKRREALVLVKRGSQDGALSPDEARAMALRWFAVAEATESDQLVSEALRATGSDDAAQGKLFGYLRKLRDTKPAALGSGRVNMPLPDWLILAGLAVVILLTVRYARRHPKVPPE